MHHKHETSSKTARLRVGLASTKEEVREAQRLRWRVFSDELGARLTSPTPGIDIDELDAYCEHLIVVDVERQAVIGTYRLLTADGARRAGGYYAEEEFDLTRIKASGARLLELGRSCVLPEYRTGATIARLWSGLAEVVLDRRHDALIGCASIAAAHDAPAAFRLARTLARDHAAPPALRSTPRLALPEGDEAGNSEMSCIPPLIKAYLRSGAMVCGEACWDADFGCADLLLLLPLDKLTARYAQHFLTARSTRELTVS